MIIRQVSLEAFFAIDATEALGCLEINMKAYWRQQNILENPNLGVLILSVRRVSDLDFDEIFKWFEARNYEGIPKYIFPKVGFIVDGTAAGFLYFTDSTVCIIDCYISNPRQDSKTRSDALDLITEELIKCAAFHRCKTIKCDTQLGVIKRRAISHGFKSIGTFEAFTMEL